MRSFKFLLQQKKLRLNDAENNKSVKFIDENFEEIQADRK